LRFQHSGNGCPSSAENARVINVKYRNPERLSIKLYPFDTDKEGRVRETQEGRPSPFKMIVFEALSELQKRCFDMLSSDREGSIAPLTI
jgi:hypothetical protein